MDVTLHSNIKMLSIFVWISCARMSRHAKPHGHRSLAQIHIPNLFIPNALACLNIQIIIINCIALHNFFSFFFRLSTNENVQRSEPNSTIESASKKTVSEIKTQSEK